ncbi:MAG: hypothetical protein NVS2B6_00600 [Thermoleophilaceae bacterium]
MARRSTAEGLRIGGAALVVVVGGVHIQQYLDFINDAPNIGALFLLNGIGTGVLCAMLGTRFRLLGALGGIGLSVGALGSVLLAGFLSSGLFGYREVALRGPIVVAVVAELLAIGVLGSYLLRARAGASTG